MVHQYKLNGYNVVIDVYSGAIHVVDDVAYDIIRLFCEQKDKYHNATHEENQESISKKEWMPDINAVTEFIIDKAYAGDYKEEPFFPLCDAVSENAGISEGVGQNNFDKARREIEECYRDILHLIKSKQLFSEDVFKPNANTLKNRHTEIKALCLHVAHSCDLTCSYCFAGQGKFNGPAALMSFDVGKRAIDFLIENSGKRHNLEVDFFGGEPLLNFDVVKKIVAYARSKEKEAAKKFRFTITTNGMGITDEVIDFVNKECHNVVLSLDGRKEVHDRERRSAGGIVDGKKIPWGTGSYDIIVPKFQRLVEARVMPRNNDGIIPEWVSRGCETGNTNYYMRGTFTHYNPDFLQDILHMLDLGFKELSMEPVVCNPESEFALTEEDLPVLMDQYEKLAIEMIKREKEGEPFTFYHYMLDLAHGPCIFKRISGCGSGTEYFAVTPQGELYPCHQFVGDENYLMGDIWKGIYKESKSTNLKSGEEIKDDFKMCNVYARKECDDCWAKLYCSGGCAANAYHATGSILGIYEYGCKLFKKRMECAIMMQIAKME